MTGQNDDEELEKLKEIFSSVESSEKLHLKKRMINYTQYKRIERIRLSVINTKACLSISVIYFIAFIYMKKNFNF